MKLNELFEIYIDDKDMSSQATTVDTVRYRYNAQLRDVFGEMELEEIDYKSIRNYQKDMISGKYLTKKGEKFSAVYTNAIVGLLKRLVKYGVLMNYFTPSVQQSRGLESIVPIADREKFKKMQIIWGLNDFNTFIKEVNEERYNVLFNVLFYAGLRKGEALSLCWRDVDMIEQTITVSTTACRVTGKGQVIKSPKSEASHRVVHINDSLNDIMLNFYLNEKERHRTNINHHFVFGGERMLSYSSLDRAFRRFKDKADVSDMNLHGFRHSHATFLLELTNDVYNISKRMGHENIEVTDTYLHVNKQIQKEMAEKIEKAIRNEREKSLEAYLNSLKRDLKKELTESSYEKEETKLLKKIYDYIVSI